MEQAEYIELREARAVGRSIRTGQHKLNIVAEMIRGMDVAGALAQLTFSRRRVAKDVKKVLQSAIANAENNHGLNIDSLYVAEAFTGKAVMMRRFRAGAKGRGMRIEKPFSNITLILRERA